MRLHELNRRAVLVKYKNGLNANQIFKKHQTRFSRKFVYYTIKSYQETNSAEDRKRSGRKNVHGVSRSTTQRLLKEGLRAQSDAKTETQNTATSANTTTSKDRLASERKRRCEALLEKYAGKNILFTAGKVFKINTTTPTADNAADATVNGVTVWAGVTPDGRTPLVCVPLGVGITAKNYVCRILEAVKPLVLAGEDWVFQQDTTPAHSAKRTQAWLKSNVKSFITKDEWPPPTRLSSTPWSSRFGRCWRQGCGSAVKTSQRCRG
ncbi:UNVERIFIED_CONTAM: hypothetical protein FKN15_029280 [Acipenser sinensis]